MGHSVEKDIPKQTLPINRGSPAAGGVGLGAASTPSFLRTEK